MGLNGLTASVCSFIKVWWSSKPFWHHGTWRMWMSSFPPWSTQEIRFLRICSLNKPACSSVCLVGCVCERKTVELMCVLLRVVLSVQLHPACLTLVTDCHVMRVAEKEKKQPNKKLAGPCKVQTHIYASTHKLTHPRQALDNSGGVAVTAGWRRLTFVLAMQSELSGFHLLGGAGLNKCWEGGVCGGGGPVGHMAWTLTHYIKRYKHHSLLFSVS